VSASSGTTRFPAFAASTRRIPGATGSSCWPFVRHLPYPFAVHRARFLGLLALLAIPFGAASSRASTPSTIVFAADRAPSLSGEIYRLDPNGRRVDLSRSAYNDTNPVVSSDGKRVAFISNRASRAGIYEVGIDGRGLVALARKVPGLEPHTPVLAWQPHGNRLAVAFPGTHRVAILRRGRKPVYVRGAWGYGSWQPWSPDGRILLVWTGHGLRGVTPQGRALWSVRAARPSGGWSSQGLLAVTVSHGAAVYDERGVLRSTIRFGPDLPNSGPIWSPDGGKLVLPAASGFDFQVDTSGGQLLLRKHMRFGELGWADSNRLVLAYIGHCGCHARYVDVRTGRLSPGSLRWFEPLSADRKLAILTPRAGSSFSLGAASPRGGATKRYAAVPGCWDDGSWEAALDSAQFAGRSRSVVYASLCYEPFSNLYSIAPDGTQLRKLAVKPYATEPVLSPDGSKIAYSWAKFTGFSCKGCASEIRVANSDGTGTRVLTNPGTDCAFDLTPTWSSDGQTILFSRGTCDTPGELFTVPAAGGTPHDLGVVGSSPAWGPSRIAYQGASGLSTANPDGSDPVEVAAKGNQPAWSADGRLAYLLGHNGTTVVVVGSSSVKLPFASVTSLAWSPDGSRFVVTARKAKTAVPDVYTVATDGTDPIRLTTNYDAWGASWR
jgi:Tol biopolymer transport system component